MEDIGFEQLIKSLTTYEIGVLTQVCMNELVTRNIEDTEIAVSNAYRKITCIVKNASQADNSSSKKDCYESRCAENDNVDNVCLMDIEQCKNRKRSPS